MLIRHCQGDADYKNDNDYNYSFLLVNANIYYIPAGGRQVVEEAIIYAGIG